MQHYTSVSAEFIPPVEQLAFSLISASEMDIPGIWLDPLPEVIHALTQNPTVEQVYANLPDINEVQQAGLTVSL